MHGLRAYRYPYRAPGSRAKTILASEALGLATVAVGAFHDDVIYGLLDVDCKWDYILLVSPDGWRW